MTDLRTLTAQIFFALACILAVACSKSEPSVPKGKLVITVDDWNVDNWYSYQDSFNKYGITLTFYVSHFHKMDSTQRNKLHLLEDKGHEIAYHTLNHPNANEYCNEHGLGNYLKDEIYAGLDLFHENGFNPRSFAFPGGRYYNDLLDTVGKIFPIVRRDNYGFYDFNKMIDSQYSLKANQKYYDCFGMDKAYLFDTMSWDNLVKKVNEGKDVALLFHSLNAGGDYSMSQHDFHYMAQSIRDNHIQCVTVSHYFQ